MTNETRNNLKNYKTVMKMKKLLPLVTLIGAMIPSIQAQVRITEVAPWASGNAPYAADWFELTNIGVGTIPIAGWTMDDDSNNSNSAPLAGITNIAAGESVIFLELAGGGNANTLINAFIAAWFGGSAPAGLQIGTYTQGAAGGVGLGAGGDAVNVFNGTAGALQARVSFGASDAVSPFQTFDNSARQDGVVLSTFSTSGTNGAFLASDGVEVGSPGSAVPEPQTYAMVLTGVLTLAGFAARRRGR